MTIFDAVREFAGWKAFSVKGNTVKQYNQTLRQFALFYHNGGIEAVTLKTISDFLNLLKDLGYQQNTFIPIAMALRKFFEYANRRGWTTIDPFFIPIPRKEFNIPRVADEETYGKLLAVNIDERHPERVLRNRLIIRLLWETGARVGEICELDRDDIELGANSAMIRTEKNRGSRPFRQIYWTPETGKMMGEWMDESERFARPALFVGLGNQKVGERITRRGVGEMLRRYSNLAGIPYANAHSFRHAKAHSIIKQTGSLADAANILGHASVLSTRPYTWMFGEELRETADKYLKT